MLVLTSMTAARNDGSEEIDFLAHFLPLLFNVLSCVWRLFYAVGFLTFLPLNRYFPNVTSLSVTTLETTL
jgi:hypothetical protein